ncbi:MAG: methyltransferase [Butyrivibrio sp.]|jgi:hypothetical protein|nr:methyltransferase [Butyrivibrio sp.]
MNGNELKKEFGDYQTPEDFACAVCEYLCNDLNIQPKYIIEPTAGIGNFIKASLKTFVDSESIVGIEVNEEYCDICRSSIPSNKVKIECSNFFGYDLSDFAKHGDQTLVVGNPPWATNSELNFNLPEKVNFKRLSGTDAITGASNFDICEYIILQLIDAFKDTNAIIAMLCKTSVARNVLQELNRTKTKAEYVKMVNFNSAKVFGISASACLLVVKLSDIIDNASVCEVSEFENPTVIVSKIKCENGVLSSAIDGVKNLEGNCQCEWRQGVKHDCSSIMELEMLGGGKYKNKKKEEVELEETLVFPLMKSSSFKQPIICEGFKKYVIVTQKKAREDTSYIEQLAPHTWHYLISNKELFDGRKSSIYNGAPAFSMFGVGDYSYAKYKVGISGFYKKPLFTLLYNADEIDHPIMLDDTTYFLSFDTYDEAYACMVLLNCESVQDFLFSISFKDAKRPYTKKVLQRLDLKKCFEEITIDELKETEKRLELKPYITESMYVELKEHVS